MKKVFQALGVPANVYSDDGSEFKREFKELMDFWDIEKQVTRGHAYFAHQGGHVAPHSSRSGPTGFLGQRIDGHQHEGVWLAPEGLHVGQVHLVHGLHSSLRPVLFLEMLGSRAWACCSVCAMLPKPVRGSS